MKQLFYFIFSVLILCGCSRENPTFRISSDKGEAESVFLTTETSGKPVIVWTERTEGKLTLFYSISNTGTEFSHPVSLPLPDEAATHAEGMPKVAFKSDGTIIAAYEKRSPTNENKYAASIYYVMSTDGGKSWSAESLVHSDTVAGRSRSFFDIQRLPDGEIGAAWLDIKMETTTGGRSVRFARTTRSNGFGNEVLIDSSACQCCRIDVYTDETKNIFVAYRGIQRGPMGKQIRDMMIATSVDNGKSFSSPLIISADNWLIDGCPHTGPSLCGNKSGLFSLWYTEGQGAGIYYAVKSDNEKNFSQRELLSASGRHPQLCASGQEIAMVWEENIKVNDDTNTVIRYRISRGENEIAKGLLTPKNNNSFMPVVAPCEGGFISAYLVEEKSRVAVYARKL